MLNLRIALVGLRDWLGEARIGQPVEAVSDRLRVILLEDVEDLALELLDRSPGAPAPFIGRA
jgi:hypothetical protein